MSATTTSLCLLYIACRCAKPWLALLVHKENFFCFSFFLNKKKGIIAFKKKKKQINSFFESVFYLLEFTSFKCSTENALL